uniref:hypothetical protein n=1 Tax=Erwinia amylovora TaxID=552 RepID=UPI0015D51384
KKNINKKNKKTAAAESTKTGFKGQKNKENNIFMVIYQQVLAGKNNAEYEVAAAEEAHAHYGDVFGKVAIFIYWCRGFIQGFLHKKTVSTDCRARVAKHTGGVQ